MMDLTEKKLFEKEIYKGKILRVHLDTVLLPDGKQGYREVADHPGGVAILAIDDQNRAALVKQYRYAFSRIMTEIPAGKRESGEAPEITAQRELKEEIGTTADFWADLGTFIPSPGCYGERIYIYLAKNLHFGETHFDDDEYLNLEWIDLNSLREQCLDGSIQDGKTVIAVLKYFSLLQDSFKSIE